MTDNRITELLPCPFCGSVDTLEVAKPDVRNATPDNYFVVCRWLDGGCGAGSGIRRTKAEAIAAWNTRAMLALRSECQYAEIDEPDTIRNELGIGEG